MKYILFRFFTVASASSQQQQQQRPARIDQIMKLFPEQNGILLNSLPHQSQPSQFLSPQQQPQQQTQQQQPNSILLGSQSSLSGIGGSSSNLANNFPHAMDCDPAPTLSTSASSTSLNQRYNALLGGSNSASANTGNGNAMNNGGNGGINLNSGNLNHRNSRYQPTMAVMGQSHPNNNNSNNLNSSSIHHIGHHSKNANSNYAPTSLPTVDLSQMISSGGGTSNVGTNDHSLAAYQHHLLTSGNNLSGNTYIPYSMSNDALVASMSNSHAAMQQQMLLQHQQQQ